jgi:hypothetical protein
MTFFWPHRPPNMKRLLLLIVLAVVGLFSRVSERIWLGVRAMCPPRPVVIMSWMVAKVHGGLLFASRWVNERIWLARRNPYATCRECQPTASAYSTPPAHPNKEVG